MRNHNKILLLLVVMTTYVSAQEAPVWTVCAAFGRDGSSARVTVATDITLKLINPAGKASSLKLPLGYPGPSGVFRFLDHCEVYFSRDSEFVALGMSRKVYQSKFTRVHVAVAEAKSATWVSDWDLQPQREFSSASLAGFFDESTSLVVVGSLLEENGRAEPNGPISIQLLSPAGQQLDSKRIDREQAQRTDAFRFYADALHNRLWYFSCSSTRLKPYHVPLCPVSATNLFGEQNNIAMELSNVREKRDNLWEWPATFVAPSATEVMVAETVNGKDTVWHITMSPQSIDRFVLPHQHFLKYNGLVQSALSPDGDVYAVLLQQREIGFPYVVDNYVFRGTDVVVLGTHPLRLLGTIPHDDSSFTTGLAVDHRDGKARVLVYRKGQWDRRELADGQSESYTQSTHD